MRSALLLLSDARFPAGGYAHSGGLEAAVEEGLQVHEVSSFLTDRLVAVSGPECALAVAAARAARSDDLAALAELDAEAEARLPSPPLRIASRRLGAQLLRTAATVWPESIVVRAYREASTITARPVAFGVVGAAAGLADDEVAGAYLYEEAAMIAAAAVRLLPLDAAESVRGLLDAEPLLDSLAAEAVRPVASARELPPSFAPALDLRSLSHAAREGRLFAT